MRCVIATYTTIRATTTTTTSTTTSSNLLRALRMQTLTSTHPAPSNTSNPVVRILHQMRYRYSNNPFLSCCPFKSLHHHQDHHRRGEEKSLDAVYPFVGTMIVPEKYSSSWSSVALSAAPPAALPEESEDLASFGHAEALGHLSHKQAGLWDKEKTDHVVGEEEVSFDDADDVRFYVSGDILGISINKKEDKGQENERSNEELRTGRGEDGTSVSAAYTAQDAASLSSRGACMTALPTEDEANPVSESSPVTTLDAFEVDSKSKIQRHESSINSANRRRVDVGTCSWEARKDEMPRAEVEVYTAAEAAEYVRRGACMVVWP